MVAVIFQNVNTSKRLKRKSREIIDRIHYMKTGDQNGL